MKKFNYDSDDNSLFPSSGEDVVPSGTRLNRSNEVLVKTGASQAAAKRRQF